MDFGVEAAGGQVIFANDVLVDACQTLKNYFHDADIRRDDIASITAFPDADVVVGGYPCQSFSMAGKRDPENDQRTNLYKQFLRAISIVRPKYFVAENVSGLKQLGNGTFLKAQLEAYDKAGYNVSHQLVNAKDYGVPQSRKRLFIFGVRMDLNQRFEFPAATHGKGTKASGPLKPYTSHGDAIKGLPLWPEGEFYERPHDPEGHFSWYYMSRNRKANWADPAFTVVANWRHSTLHPAGPVMTLTWSKLDDGFKQRWDFSDQYEHLEVDPKRHTLEKARRLSWRECARIQTFSPKFEPAGDAASKFTQIGNAVPPLLAKAMFTHLFTGAGLVEALP